MNLNITSDTPIADSLKTKFWKELLKNTFGQMVYNMFGKKAVIEKRGGKTVQFRRVGKFTPDLTPLTEGAAPTGRKIAVTTNVATVTQHGTVVDYTDMFDEILYDNLIGEIIRETLPENAIETLEKLAAAVYCAGTNIRYVAGDTRAALTASNILTLAVVDLAVKTLKQANAPLINGKYICIVGPEATYDIQQSADWKDPYKYANRTMGLYPSEIGMYKNVRFVESTYAHVFKHKGAGTGALHTTLDAAAAAGQKVVPLAATTGLVAGDVCQIRDASGYFEEEVVLASVSSGVSVTLVSNLTRAFAASDTFDKGDDVFAALIFGKDAMGSVSLTGMRGGRVVGISSFEIIQKALGSGGTSDPLNQVGTVSWKAAVAYIRLDEERMVRIEHGATGETS